MAELKPCPFCGYADISVTVNTRCVKLWCPMCGVRMTRGGKKESYSSIGMCRKYVMPIAIDAWNRRADDGMV